MKVGEEEYTLFRDVEYVIPLQKKKNFPSNILCRILAKINE